MGFLFVLALIAAVVAMGGLGVMFAARSEDTRNGGLLAGLVGGFFAVVLTVLSSATYVPANEVGIVTSFGRWVGTAESGLTWWQPWASVDTFPTRNQKSVRDQADSSESNNYNCVNVKMTGNASACVDATILYTIDAKNARTLWEGWKDFTKLNTDLINRATDDAFNNVYSGYAAEQVASKRAEITERISKELGAKLAKEGVQLESVTLGDTHLPKEVQDRVNSILAADAKVEVAKRAEAEAQAQSRANAARQQALTPEALIMECLAVAREVKPQIMDCMGGAKAPVILGNR